MDNAPEESTAVFCRLDDRRPFVDDIRSSMPSKSSSPSSLRSLADFRAFWAQSGSGLMRSNCLRKRDSYSPPERMSSLAVSRNFRRLLSEDKDTEGMSLGSSQAAPGFFRAFGLSSGSEVDSDPWLCSIVWTSCPLSTKNSCRTY